jgi:hypothetical protein
VFLKIRYHLSVVGRECVCTHAFGHFNFNKKTKIVTQERGSLEVPTSRVV